MVTFGVDGAEGGGLQYASSPNWFSFFFLSFLYYLMNLAFNVQYVLK